ncbi:suppressor of fused domain protein [Jeotgalibacillus haloalkalitolerans]|uniref:Suppressor of fused domain protein n=1 Tax=Jeotgalibacillus haloalkalitolerans TaxID=3104292 RepID=A0ABU5KJE6_9BACL|nr:suppressor of fused domain protein [Jeotgalibacillus sp. HH7-29]MDZ5711382.1 suppressor of fused domain protein [Jeotgalibacillus sp. HH7-29]
MFEGTLMEAVYVTSPVYFKEAFFVCVDEPGLEIIMAWLIPVTAEEAAFINQYGGEAFEDLLEREDPDLTDLGRVSLV